MSPLEHPLIILLSIVLSLSGLGAYAYAWFGQRQPGVPVFGSLLMPPSRRFTPRGQRAFRIALALLVLGAALRVIPRLF